MMTHVASNTYKKDTNYEDTFDDLSCINTNSQRQPKLIYL